MASTEIGSLHWIDISEREEVDPILFQVTCTLPTDMRRPPPMKLAILLLPNTRTRLLSSTPTHCIFFRRRGRCGAVLLLRSALVLAGSYIPGGLDRIGV